MNRILAPAYVLLLTISAAASPDLPVTTQIHDRGMSGISIDFRLPPADRMTAASSENIESVIYTEDDKEVPVIRRWVRVPPGHSVDVDIKNRESFLLSKSDIDGELSRSLVHSDEFGDYQLDPPEPVSVGKTIVFRGVPIASISIYPVQYIQGNDIIVENTQLDVDFNFIPDPTVNSNVRTVYDPPGSEAARFMNSMLLNPPRRDYDEMQFPCLAHILIVYGSRLPGSVDEPRSARGAVEKFANWKRQMGYQVDIEVIDRLEMPVDDLRQMIRDYYYFVNPPEIPISHLVIVGQDSIQDNFYFPSHDEGDNYFALMDDDEAISPDISVGRFYIGGATELETVVNRTILYEREPYADPNDGYDWYSKATFTAENIGAPDGQFVASMGQMGRWVYDRLTRFADPQYIHVDTLYSRDSTNAGILGQTFDALEDGRSFAISRGWLMGCMDINDELVDTDRKHPFVAAITCLSHHRQITFFKNAGTVRNPKGPIASLAMFGDSKTKTNQCVVGWIVRGMVYEKMHQPGWIQLFSKLQLASDYRYDRVGLLERVIPTLGFYRLMGDPTVNVFTGPPQRFSAEHPETITPNATGLNVFIDSEAIPFPNAAVCLWQPDGIQLVTMPGDDGWARFTFDPGSLEEGDLLLTVTHPNTFVVIDTITVQEQEIMIDMVDVDMDNDDGLFSNGETVPTSLVLQNTGNATAEDVTVYLSSENPWISYDEDSIALGDIEANQERSADFNLHIHESSKPGLLVRIDVRIVSGDNEWQHSYQIDTAGPMLATRRILFDEGEFDRGQTVELIPELINLGSLPSTEVSVRLVCLNERYVNAIEIVTEEVTYPAISSDQYTVPGNNGSFTIELDSTVVPGDTARFNLELFAEGDEEDFRDTVYFECPIGDLEVRDPFGPDEYGYICFDSGDVSWDKAPVYDWIEINPSEEDFDYEGTKLWLEDYHEDEDTSAVVDIPFTFQYYGERFDTLIVCTNGWIAFGIDNSWYHLFRNWPIPGIQGPDAQIAVLWQDLRVTGVLDNRGVYHYYDEDRGIFIVEWSKMQIYYGDNAQADSHLVEFQVILYDPSEHYTSTGDGEIKMQYKTFDEFGGMGHDNQYSTIGLKNLDNTGGLMYAFWNHYTDDRCMHLENETALYFTVDVKTAFGALAGRVVDAGDTNRVLTNVEVMLNRSRLIANTDEDGTFHIDSIAVGREIILSSLATFNTMIDTAIINEAETTWVDVYMTYPLFRYDEEPIEAEARPGYGVGGDLTAIYNDGIGPLEYSVARRYHDGSELGYDHVQSLRVDEEAETDYVYGCQFVGDSIYVCYTHDRNTPGNAYVGVFDRNGNQVRRFLQPCDLASGFWDMAYDGEYIYGGDVRGDTAQVIVRVDLEGNHVDDITVQIPRDEWDDIGFPMALAYDPEHSHFFVASYYSKIYKCDLNGNIIDQFYINLPGGIRPNVTGMAWNPVDDDNMPLYLMDWVHGEDDRRMRLIKVDPVTHRVRILDDISRNIRDHGKSLTVGFDWQQGIANLAAIADAVGGYNDSLRIYEIGPDSRFLMVNNPTGWINAGAQGNLNIIMSAEYYDEECTLEMGLLINHNAREDAGLVQITFHVDPNSEIDDEAPLPLVFGLDQAYPNPFNAETRIGYTLDRASFTRLAVYDVTGRLVDVLVDGEMPVGRHMVSFNAEGLASGLYFYRIDAGDKFEVKRMVLLR